MMRRNIALSLLMIFPLAANALPYVYVANNASNVVNVIDAATNTLVTTIILPALPSAVAAPTCIAIAPNGQTVCVANSNYPAGKSQRFTLSVIDATLEIPALITTSASIGEGTATCIAYTTDSNSVYVANTFGYLYYITTINTNPTLDSFISSLSPICIAIGNTPNGETAYIGSNGQGIYSMPVPANTASPIPSSGDANTNINAITVSPNGLTVYAVGQNSVSGIATLFAINTTSNTVSATISLGLTNPSGIVISPDGNYLYITDNEYGNIIVIPTANLSSKTSFMSPAAIALAITPNSQELFVTDTSANVSPYLVPAGASAGASLALGGSTMAYSIVIGGISLLPPSSVNGCKTKNVFLLQTDYINNITWTAPASGSPAAYAIYRDSALTQLAGIVPASGPLQYYDHDRNPNITYTYYIVSVDASGNQSAPATITVTQSC